MYRTIVEVDLVGYSSIASILEDNIDSAAVAGLNVSIQKFIDQGLSAVNASRPETVMATTGDGAILVFERAADAHYFAAALHQATIEHNKIKGEPSAKRFFRVGAASGDIVIQARSGGYDIAGVTIARAVRLEAAARPGEFVIDKPTLDGMPPLLRKTYGPVEEVRGKRDERFAASRCAMNAEVPEWFASPAIQHAKKAVGSHHEILSLFEELRPRDLDRLIFLLEIPIKERPPATLSVSERENHILRNCESALKLERLESELRYLVGKEKAEPATKALVGDTGREGDGAFKGNATHTPLMTRQNEVSPTEIESNLRVNAGRKDQPHTEAELLESYHKWLRPQVGEVTLFGEQEPRHLDAVFVELGLVEGYQRPFLPTDWLSFMDTVLRRQRESLSFEDEEWDEQSKRRRYVRPGEKLIVMRQHLMPGAREGKWGNPTIKPADLLKRKVNNIVVGAPGAGKTTLLKYLTLRELAQNNRFPVFLELKRINRTAFEGAQEDLASFLFDKAVAGPLHSVPDVRNRLKELFFAKLNKGEVSIFLDGLDEIGGATFFDSLCRSISDFPRSFPSGNRIVVSTRPYSLYAGVEGLEELEIVPLNRRQVEEFLNHYFDDEAFKKEVLRKLSHRLQLRELARVPFLLGVIVALFRHEGKVIGGRLELYRHIVQELVVRSDRVKSVERYTVKDPDGSLKLDFLKRLAFERLFVDKVDKASERLLIAGDLILERARLFCPKDVNPFLFVADIKATPLLREVGSDTYAFAHLTLQEYLAAKELSERIDCVAIFSRAYFNPALAELEVLPMTLGLYSNPDDLYETVEHFPDSLSYLNLRLRLRGLAYTSRICQERLMNLSDSLIGFISGRQRERRPYFEAMVNTISSMNSESAAILLDRLIVFLAKAKGNARVRCVQAIGKMGDDRGISVLHASLRDPDRDVRISAIRALGRSGDKRSVRVLSKAVKDKDATVGWHAAQALQAIGGEQSVNALLLALREKKWTVRWNAIEALRYVGDQRAVSALIKSLRDENPNVRSHASSMLEQIGDERVVDGLLLTLKAKDPNLRRLAAEKLGKLRNPRSIKGLLQCMDLSGNEVRWHAAVALAQIGPTKLSKDGAIPKNDAAREQRRIAVFEKVLQILIERLRSTDHKIRDDAAQILKGIGGEKVEEALHELLKESDPRVRFLAGRSLVGVCNEHAVEAMLALLKDENDSIRGNAATVLGRFRHSLITKALIAALDDESPYVRIQAAYALKDFDDEKVVKAKLRKQTARDGFGIEMLESVKDPRAIRGLTKLLVESPDGNTRARAADALGTIGNKRPVPELIKALNDTEDYVREAAAWALGRIGDGGSVPHLLAALKDIDYSVQNTVAWALRSMAEAALVLGLLNAISGNNPFAKSRAIETVSYYSHDNDVLRKLSQLALNDSPGNVRRIARKAASKLREKLALLVTK